MYHLAAPQSIIPLLAVPLQPVPVGIQPMYLAFAYPRHRHHDHRRWLRLGQRRPRRAGGRRAVRRELDASRRPRLRHHLPRRVPPARRGRGGTDGGRPRRSLALRFSKQVSFK